jgi:hypothetical protein
MLQVRKIEKETSQGVLGARIEVELSLSDISECMVAVLRQGQFVRRLRTLSLSGLPYGRLSVEHCPWTFCFPMFHDASEQRFARASNKEETSTEGSNR